MRRIILCFLLFACCYSYGQNVQIDSLKNVLNSKSGESRIEVLHDLVKSLWTIKPEEALIYGKEAINLSKAIGNLKLESISYRLLGGVFNYMSDIDSGRYYKTLALKMALELNDSLLIGPTYNNLGVTAQTVGHHIEALEYYYRAYLICAQLDEFEALPIVISNISEVYYDLHQYDSAIKYADIAVELNSKKPIQSSHLLAKTNLARAKHAKGQNAEARKLYESIIELGKSIGDKRYTAYAHQGLGRLGVQLETHYAKALTLFIELDDQAYIAEIYMDLGNHHMRVNPDSALHYTRMSMAIAQELNLNDILIRNHKNLIEFFSAANNMDSLYHYSSRYDELIASNQQVTNSHSIEGMFFKIQDEQNRYMLGEQTLKLQKQAIQNQFLILIAIITFVLATAILYFFLKQRKLSDNLAHANQQLISRTDLIDKKNQDLEALNKEKNDLINIVAHDLRNPLANISAVAQMVGEHSDSNERMNLVELIEISTHRMLSMINKILNIKNIERGSVAVEMRPVNLTLVTEEIVRTFANPAQQKNIEIKLELTEGLKVLGDLTHVYQVIENLVSNAIKYSPKGKTIYVKLFSNQNTGSVEVRDEGPGIAENEQAQLFQMYRKLSPTPTDGETSTGLGLSIARKFMEAMDGKIWCDSELGSGTSFFVQFRLA